MKFHPFGCCRVQVIIIAQPVGHALGPGADALQL
jgi:hypothetical protein